MLLCASVNLPYNKQKNNIFYQVGKIKTFGDCPHLVNEGTTPDRAKPHTYKTTPGSNNRFGVIASKLNGWGKFI